MLFVTSKRLSKLYSLSPTGKTKSCLPTIRKLSLATIRPNSWVQVEAILVRNRSREFIALVRGNNFALRKSQSCHPRGSFISCHLLPPHEIAKSFLANGMVGRGGGDRIHYFIGNKGV